MYMLVLVVVVIGVFPGMSWWYPWLV